MIEADETFIFLSIKTRHIPIRAMRIGWQEWDQVYLGSEDVYSPTPSTGKEGDQDDDSTDWWNADQEDPDPYSAASLPLDEWLPLQVHDTGGMCTASGIRLNILIRIVQLRRSLSRNALLITDSDSATRVQQLKRYVFIGALVWGTDVFPGQVCT